MAPGANLRHSDARIAEEILDRFMYYPSSLLCYVASLALFLCPCSFGYPAVLPRCTHG